jgi:ssDNA-binding Zn-finger/Zn-ribbon topoisomerase 1
MISIDRKKDVERCPVCGKVAVRVYLVKLAVLEFILCHGCLNDLKYKIFEHTRWP